jgi:hypothetical protein
VLKGVRFLSQDLADEVLRQLRISLLDLVRAEEIGLSMRHTSPARREEIAVPVLGERLGPGYPFPSKETLKGFMLVPSYGLEFVRDPALVFLGPDQEVEACFPGAMVVLLDFGMEPAAASRSTFWCALSLRGGGCLRQVALSEGGMRVVVPSAIGLESGSPPDPGGLIMNATARAVALWVGRDFPGPAGLSQDGFLAVSS